MPKRSKNQKLHRKMKAIYDRKPGSVQTKTSTNPNTEEAKNAKKVKGSHLRDSSKINLLNMYNSKPDL